MKVLILHTLPPETAGAARSVTEFDLNEAAVEIARCLPGAEAVGVHGAPHEIIAVLQAARPEVVFNLCEAPLGRPELEAHVAALLEWRGIRFTGSGSQTLALCRRKDWTKAVLRDKGVAVPDESGFPCIVKPAAEDGSFGIDGDSLCHDDAAVARARARLAGPALVEAFLPGKEFVVSLWGPDEPECTSIGDVSFHQGLNLFTYAAKWDEASADYANSRLHYHTALEPCLRAALLETARRTWRAVGARGYLRLDLRLDREGLPRVLDVNPNPEISPDVGMHRAVLEAGWSWERFLRAQVEWSR